MPLFFFDIYEDGDFTRDEIGTELGSLQEARDQAALLLPGMVQDVMLPREHQQFAVVVRHSDGAPAYGAVITFEGRWRQADKAGWDACIDPLHPSYSPLATLRSRLLVAADRTVASSRTRATSSRLASLDMQDLIRSTRTTVAASRVMLGR